MIRPPTSWRHRHHRRCRHDYHWQHRCLYLHARCQLERLGADDHLYRQRRQGGSDTADLDITVDPVTDLTAADDSVTTDEDTPVNGSVAGNDSTTSGGTLTFEKASDPSHGAVVVNPDGTYTYTPDANYNGPDSFTYTVTDPASGETLTRTVDITVTPVNDAPTTVGTIGDQADADADTITSLDVTSFFTDIDSPTLTYSASGLPAGLTIDPVTGVISGTVDNSASQGGSGGVYSVTVTATDGDGASVDQTFDWTVTNPAPVATDDTDSTNEDTPVSGNVLSNDSDPDGDTLSVTEFTVAGDPATHAAGDTVTIAGVGTITIGSTGAYTFTPDANWNGSVPTITYTVSDGEGGSDTADLDITVDPVTDLTAADDSVTTDEDTPVNGSVAGNDSTTSGGTLTFEKASDPSHGAVVVNPDGTYTYTPDANYNGPDSFTYTVTDPASGETLTRTVDITVDPVNDAPTTVGTIGDQADADADTITSLDVTSFFTDIDSPTLTYSASGLPAGLTIDPVTGVISGTVDNSASQGGSGGVYSVTVTATDGDGASVDQTFDWTVTNPAPVATDDTDSTNEDTPVSGNVLSNDSDPDGDTLSVTEFTVAGDPTTHAAGDTVTIAGVGTITIGSTGAYTFTPDANWNGSVPTITYTVSDGEGGSDTADLDITVDPVNDAPTTVGTIGDQADADADTITSLDVTSFFTDIDSPTLTYSASGLPAGLTIDPVTGVISGTVDNSASQGGSGGVYSVTVTATDGDGASVDQTFDWTVTNPAPVATDDTDSTNEDTPVSGNVFRVRL
ncbi:MAG: Ig-like domain-containing protein [Erythrobacter sp.]